MRPHFKCCEMSVCESHLCMTCPARKNLFNLFYWQRFTVWSLVWTLNEMKLFNDSPTTINKNETVNLLIQRNFEKLAFYLAFCANTVPLEDLAYCTTSCGATSGHFKQFRYIALCCTHEGTLKVIAEKCTHLNWGIFQCVELNDCGILGNGTWNNFNYSKGIPKEKKYLKWIAPMETEVMKIANKTKVWVLKWNCVLSWECCCEQQF